MQLHRHRKAGIDCICGLYRYFPLLHASNAAECDTDLCEYCRLQIAMVLNLIDRDHAPSTRLCEEN